MNFLKTTAASAVVLTMIGTAASAASWDFGQDAEDFYNNNDFEGTFFQVYGGPVLGDGGDGITVDAFAQTHPSGDSEYDPVPFMDSYSNNMPAGLGVCSSGFDGIYSDCSSGNPDGSTPANDSTSDDNLVFPEVLGLVFSSNVWLRDLFIRDAGHNPEEGSLYVWSPELGLDGDDHPAYVELTIIGGVVQNSEAAGFSTTFYFTSAGSAAGQEIYIETLSASVPLPAAGWLLIGGLSGLAAMKRRKKAA